ncbi:uncharacterized protein LOC134216665 [Armigeres subalbatus]|uniref:uncharacterized protein LOC134216665 n=1 Tax=Armigeres subalbatus TaxID=124917 RepID=UPI002ED0DA0E
MNHCSVVSCLNSKRDKQFKFFNFPSDPDICSQWVQFCHCPEISDRLLNNGPYGLTKFVICSEHFDPNVVCDVVHRKLPLPASAVPYRIGKTHMTEKMLLENGFDVKQSRPAHPKRSYVEESFDDVVLVEMLDPEDQNQESNEEDSNFEFIRMKSDDQLFEFENGFKQEFVESDEEVTGPHSELTSSDVQKREKVVVIKECRYCSQFKPRYNYEVAKNKNLEELIKKNKKNIAEATTKLQKLHDRLTLRRIKRNKLKKMYQELKVRFKRQTQEGMNPPESEEGSASDDESTEPWW